MKTGAKRSVGLRPVVCVTTVALLVGWGIFGMPEPPHPITASVAEAAGMDLIDSSELWLDGHNGDVCF
ncbi:hypothetical protein DIPPA_07042 [Diplonema papillatum]|nr:hypothetical protein DIPPA_07042 [Diplonema papillatum]